MTLPAPTVLGPIPEGAKAIQVCGAVPGARVQLQSNGVEAGEGFVGRGTSVAVEPSLAMAVTRGRGITATQLLGEDVSPRSKTVHVEVLDRLHTPRVLTPVAYDDRLVWVSGVTPGTEVTITTRGNEVGHLPAGEPIVAVPVERVAGTVEATVRLGDEERRSAAVRPVFYPGVPGPFSGVSELQVTYGEHQVPRLPNDDGPDGGYPVGLRGLVHLPTSPDAAATRRPLVLIAHGFWGDDRSYEGYRWLGEHLAKWGFVVCSIDLHQVDLQTAQESTQQWARGDVLLAMLEALSDDARLGGRIDRARVGLVGHSMSGEGVVAAQVLNLRRRRTFGIRGIAGLAPTNWEPEIASSHAAYLQLHGSLDYLLTNPDGVTGERPSFGGFRLYDRAWRHRTLGYIEGAGHDEWNSVWVEQVSHPHPEGHQRPVALTPERQQQIGRELLTPFFLDTLLDQHAYRGYLAGPVRLRDPAGSLTLLQHQSPSVVVVDDFGDGDEQLRLDPQPPDKTVNRREEPVEAAGDGLELWEDREHVELARSVHDTRSADLAWDGRGVSYSSGLDAPPVVADGALTLRLAQHYDENGGDPDERWNPAGRDLDLLVELDDGAHRSTVRLGSVRAVTHPLPGVEVYSVFQTVRLPLDAFAAARPALDVGALEAVRLRFVLRDTGRLLIDDIEFVTPLVTEPGRVRMLRAHQRGGYGPLLDHLDADVVVHIDSRPGDTFGLRLTPDEGLPAARGAFVSLRRALVTDQPVRLVHVPAGPTVSWLVGVDGVPPSD